MASSCPNDVLNDVRVTVGVKRRPTIGNTKFVGFVTAMCSFFVSMMNTASGARSRPRIPPRVALQLNEFTTKREPLSGIIFESPARACARIPSSSHTTTHGGEVGEHAPSQRSLIYACHKDVRILQRGLVSASSYRQTKRCHHQQLFAHRNR